MKRSSREILALCGLVLTLAGMLDLKPAVAVPPRDELGDDRSIATTSASRTSTPRRSRTRRMRWAMPRRRTGSRSCSRTTGARPARWRRSSGTRFYQDDLAQRVWRHAEISRARYPQLSPKLRAVLEAYVAGVRRFMAEHPEQVPAWAQEIHPWDSVALSRYIIWGWPLGEAVHELGAAGIRLTPPAYRGSNEMLIAPGRTAMKAPIAVVDPHLSWYGSFRFYEARLYARDEAFSVSGVAILGQPIPSLGHSRYCSVAMTTGGPDTSDVYEEEVNLDDPRSYRFDGQWRKMTVRTYQIGVKEGAEVKQRTVDVEYTHHGPVVARKAGKAYTIAIPYMEQVELGDQIYEMPACATSTR